MYYYIHNEEIKTVEDTEAEALVKRSRLARTKKTDTLPNGSTRERWELDAVVTEIKYIESLAGTRWTNDAIPIINKSQKLSISDAGDWVIEDKTTEEINRDMAEEFSQIDRETQAKIFEGFEYDGHTFSMSLSAQTNWSHLFDLLNAGSFPASLNISTKDHGEYSLSKDRVAEFLQVAFTHKENVLVAGRKKKKELQASYAE